MRYNARKTNIMQYNVIWVNVNLILYNAFRHIFVTQSHFQCRGENQNPLCMFNVQCFVENWLLFNFTTLLWTQLLYTKSHFDFFIFCSESFSGSSSPNSHARVSHLKCVMFNSEEGILTMIKSSILYFGVTCYSFFHQLAWQWIKVMERVFRSWGWHQYERFDCFKLSGRMTVDDFGGDLMRGTKAAGSRWWMSELWTLWIDF